jgi:hypothetical protein
MRGEAAVKCSCNRYPCAATRKMPLTQLVGCVGKAAVRRNAGGGHVPSVALEPSRIHPTPDPRIDIRLFDDDESVDDSESVSMTEW